MAVDSPNSFVGVVREPPPLFGWDAPAPGFLRSPAREAGPSIFTSSTHQEVFILNSRQRVKSAINFCNPDRVPISHAVLPAAQIKYGKALDEILTEFREDFGWDYMQDLPAEDFPAVYKHGRNIDDFGTVWFSEWLGVCGIPIEWPLCRFGALRRLQVAGGFHRRTAFRKALQRPHDGLRRSLVRARRLGDVLRTTPAVAGNGKLHGGYRHGVEGVLSPAR